MKTILTLPDGSAINSRFVAAITWDKSRAGEYGSPACIRIHVIKEGFLGGSQHMEQAHYLAMNDDDAARTACEALVRQWKGEIFKPSTEQV